jgi:hypothetical protein
MLKKSFKGDIFKTGINGDYQFILIFGSGIGINEMGITYRKFQSNNFILKDIKNPFESILTPIQINGRYFQFVPSQKNYGISDTELEIILHNAFTWALKNNIYNIITNGIEDTDSKGTLNRTVSIAKRICLIREICERSIYSKLEISLICLNDTYINFTQ